MGELIPVRLLARFGSCNPGEVAGYPPDVASQLVAKGHAAPFGGAPDGEGDQNPPAGDGEDDEGQDDGGENGGAEGEGELGEGANDDEGEEEASADGESSGASAPPASTPAKARRPGNRRTS